MLPHASPSATWKFQGRGVDQHGKEWFCDRDVCQILRYREAITKKVKEAYKILLGAVCAMDIEDDLYHKKTINFFLLASSINFVLAIHQ